MSKPIRSLTSLAVFAVLCSQGTFAGGFSLYTEGNGYSVGNFAAGVAAEAIDASIGWYNPAGLSRIHEQQAVFGGIGVFPTSKITGTSTYRTVAAPFGALPPYNQSFSGLDGARDAFVPSFHYALPLGPKATFGLSVVAPFGLSTEWFQTSPVRYAATFTELLTTDVSPEIGGQITENLSLGLGLDLEYAKVKYNSMVGSPALQQVLGLNPMGFDSQSYNKGDSFGIGFHAGALLQFNEEHTRIGFNYQSQVRQQFSGYSRLNGRLANTPNGYFWSTNLTSNDIDLPEIATLSAYQDVNDSWAVLGSVVYTGWSSIETIQLNNVAAAALVGGNIVNLPANVSAAQNYRDTWRFALGLNYKVNDALLLRIGGGYDQTPTVDADRDIRLPDADRWALAVGGHYQLKPNIGVDVGYTYLKAVGNSGINKTSQLGATSSYNVTADISAYAHLVGAQLVWKIDEATTPMPTK